MRLLLLTPLCLAMCSPLSAQNAATFKFTEPPGPHAVGLKVVEQYDYSRTYRPATDAMGKPWPGERARPMQTLIWYPAQAGSGQPMKVGDYLNLAATETSFGQPRPAAEMAKETESTGPTLADSMWARRDAPPAPGRFPVVIYAPSFSAPTTENVDLCEFLASHGYVVVSAPDMGVSARNMTDDLPGIAAQVQDIEFLIAYAKTLPDADISELAVAGYSWGGISNLFAAARDSRIRALVALDGSMRYFPELVRDSGYVHPEQMTIPLLYFTQGEITVEDQAHRPGDGKPAPNVLNQWTHGDLITVHMLGMTHGEYSSMNQRDESMWKNFARGQKADYGRADGVVGYAWVARYTLQFLNGYLKQDAAGIAFLQRTAAQNGAPAHFFSVNDRPGKGVPATLDAFRAELGRQGFDHVAAVYAAILKDNPTFKLKEAEVNSWGYELMAANHLPEAIELFKWNVTMHSDSGNPYDSLAEAYQKAGQKQLAIDNYKLSLERDNSNANAIEQLKLLGASPPPKL